MAPHGFEIVQNLLIPGVLASQCAIITGMIRVFKDCHHVTFPALIRDLAAAFLRDTVMQHHFSLRHNICSATADISIKTDFADEIIHIFHDAPGVDVDEVSSLPCLAQRTLRTLRKCPLAIGCDQCPINIKKQHTTFFFHIRLSLLKTKLLVYRR